MKKKRVSCRDIKTMTAAEAFSDLYCTLSQEAGENWLYDSRMEDNITGEVRDPSGRVFGFDGEGKST